MNSRINGPHGRIIDERVDDDAHPVREDRASMSMSDVEILESGIDIVERAVPATPISRELARWEPSSSSPDRQLLEAETGRGNTDLTMFEPIGLRDHQRHGVSAQKRGSTPRLEERCALSPRKFPVAGAALRIFAAFRALFTRVVRARSEEPRGARMKVEEIIRIPDGRTVFVGQLEGAHRFVEPSLWWVMIEGRGSIVIGVEGEVMTSRQRPSRAIATREMIDADVLRSHAGSIELVEIKDR
jgi:hypothetical protein